MKFFLVFAGLGLFILAFILASIDLQKTFDILSKANLWLVVLSVAAAGVSIALKSLKWKVLIGIYDSTHSLRRCMKAWLVGFAVGIATPGRIGDFSRAYYIKEKIGMGKSLVTVVMDRLIDIVILFCLSIAGMLSFLAILANQSTMLATTMIFFSVFLLGIYVFSRKSVLKAVMKPLYRRVVPERYKQRFNAAAGDFVNGIDTMKSRKKVVASSALIGIAAWFFSILQFYFLAVALGINISYVFLLSIMPIVVLFDTLPVSIAGIGTRDALLVLFFGAIALSKEQAISFSFMVLIFGYLLIGAAGTVILLGEGRKGTIP